MSRELVTTFSKDPMMQLVPGGDLLQGSLNGTHLGGSNDTKIYRDFEGFPL